MNTFLMILSIFSALGIPSMFAIGCFAVKTMNGHLKHQKEESNALKYGMQAMLRDVLLKRYKEISADGYATYEEKENYQHLYEQYKALGGNGVMDKVYDTIINLPLK